MAYLYRHQKVPYYTNIVYELSEAGSQNKPACGIADGLFCVLKYVHCHCIAYSLITL
ncbi:hypothetical protein D3C72_774970 [compost metagenome]